MTTVKRFNELINNTFEISQTKDDVKTVYVSGDDVKLYVNKHYGSAYCYYDNTTDLKADFEHFNRLHVTDFIRLLDALKFDYNPCENFDKYSDITVNHTGTIGTQSSSTMTSKVNAFDNSSLVTDGETIGSGGNTTTLNNSDGTIEHTHGNIGVQTVSNMILQSGTGEAYLRFNSFVEHYLNRWVCGCIVGYGDEENEIEVAPSTEYATKTEFDNLANDVVSIADTVATHTESINTLDNSLGATISDLREAENDIQTLDGVVNNLGSDVSNHETRIEALESAPISEIIYSTSERKIGKWIDNRDLYEITIQTTTPTVVTDGTTVQKKIPFTCNMVVSLDAFVNSPSIGATTCLPTMGNIVNNTLACARAFYDYTNGVTVNSSLTLLNNRDMYITIRYTK